MLIVKSTMIKGGPEARPAYKLAAKSKLEPASITPLNCLESCSDEFKFQFVVDVAG